MLDEASDQDEPETYQQEPERDSAPEPVASPQPSAQTQRRPVWEDPDDAAAVVDISGRSRLRKLRQHDDEQTVTGAACQHPCSSAPTRASTHHCRAHASCCLG